MEVNLVQNILGKYHTSDQGNPLVNDLFTLVRETRLLLNNESPAEFHQLAGSLAVFKSKYDGQIMTLVKLKKFIANIEFILAIGYQSDMDRSSWLNEDIREEAHTIPNMLHDQSLQYYKWLGKVSVGFGDIVEIGCWMGATTFQLADGLSVSDSPQKVIHAIDSFEWSDGFRQYEDHEDLKHLKDGDDFLNYFIQYTSLYRQYILPHRHVFLKNEILSQHNSKHRITNSNNPIEYLIQDISPDYDFNEYIWKLFSPFFVDRKTILVYGEYGNFFATDLRRFVRDYSDHLHPIHKVYGNVKAFLYCK